MILVTGGNGYLGKAFISKFLSTKQVVPLFRSEKVKVKLEYWEADLVRKDHIETLKNLPSSPETIVHLAGYIDISLKKNEEASNSNSPPVPGKENIYSLYANNVLATANLLDYALHKKVKHIIFASSQAVYGMTEEGVFKETATCDPLEHYASSKVCAETLLKIGTRQGLSVTTLRFPGLYGENRRNGIVYNFCKSALENKEIKVDINIPLPFDIIHISDVVDAIEKVIYFEGDGWTCFNISTGEPCNVNLLAKDIARLVPGCSVHPTFIKQPTVKMDPSKAFRILGWKASPRIERLCSMIESVKNEG